MAVPMDRVDAGNGEQAWKRKLVLNDESLVGAEGDDMEADTDLNICMGAVYRVHDVGRAGKGYSHVGHQSVWRFWD